MTDDSDDILRYDRMVESALRGVVKKSVEDVMSHGLPGEHHFYITFLTDYPGVSIPPYLKERYPSEMTIVLQYQFSDLTINDERMTVSLSFNNVPEKLIIPLGSITIFADPSVNFALQFQPMSEDIHPDDFPDFDPDDTPDGDGSSDSDQSDSTGEVISLDNFRKK